MGIFRKGGKVMAGKRRASLSEAVKRSVAEQGYLTVRTAVFEIVRVIDEGSATALRIAELIVSVFVSLAVCNVVGELNPDKSIWVYNVMFGCAHVFAATAVMPYVVMVVGNLFRFLGAVFRGVAAYVKSLFVAERREFDRY